MIRVVGDRWMRTMLLVAGAIGAGAVLASAGSVWGPAFVIRTEPGAGAAISDPPSRVRVWFDGPVEPLYAAIAVEDRGKRRIDKGDGRVHPDDRTLLEVGLPRLPSGRYRVTWRVIARDGHAREGSFSFLLK